MNKGYLEILIRVNKERHAACIKNLLVVVGNKKLGIARNNAEAWAHIVRELEKLHKRMFQGRGE